MRLASAAHFSRWRAPERVERVAWHCVELRVRRPAIPCANWYLVLDRVLLLEEAVVPPGPIARHSQGPSVGEALGEQQLVHPGPADAKTDRGRGQVKPPGTRARLTHQ